MDLTFKTYLFRCSSLGKIMTGQRAGLTARQTNELSRLQKKRHTGRITDNQIITIADLIQKRDAAPKLSQTTIAYLKELHKEIIFNRSAEFSSKYTEKGIHAEEKSFTLYCEVVGKLLVKNKKRFNNEFITGEPDNCFKKVRDIKTSWDWLTFPLYETDLPDKNYYWQLLGYMALTGYKTAQVIYCLTDTPEMLIEDEKRRLSWKAGYIDITPEMDAEIQRNYTYDDIPKELRIKTFNLKYNEDDIKALYAQIELCRAYMAGLSLAVVGHLEIKT